jgi:hypothetical protein
MFSTPSCDRNFKAVVPLKNPFKKPYALWKTENTFSCLFPQFV